MKKLFLVVAMALSVAPPVRADMFGGDVVVLVKILSNSIQQLYQLKQVVDSSRGMVDIMADVNRGLHAAMDLARTTGIEPSVLGVKNYRSVHEALSELEKSYGASDAGIDKGVADTDKSVAQALYASGKAASYAGEIDQIGESIKSRSHVVSPGGAQKVTAQGVGVMLNVMSESLKVQSQNLSLDAKAKAASNHSDKERTKIIQRDIGALRAAMAKQKVKFEAPKF